MNHKQMVSKFNRIARKVLDDDYFLYKIPDTKGLGGLRPFDSVLLYNGTCYAIEFKTITDRVKKHQKYFLNKILESGGIPIIVNENEDMDELLHIIYKQQHSILKTAFCKYLTHEHRAEKFL